MNRTSHSYYAVFINYGKRGLEAVVQPEITRREVVARIKSGEYRDIAFIHHIEGPHVFDCTAELMHDAGMTEQRFDDNIKAIERALDRQSIAWDASRNHRVSV